MTRRGTRRPPIKTRSLRWRFYLAVTVLIGLAQAFVALHGLPEHWYLRHWEALGGAVLCICVTALLLLRVSTRWVEQTVLLGVTALFAGGIVQTWLTAVHTDQHQFFVALFVIILAVASLPVRTALIWSACAIGALGSLAFKGHSGFDVTMLVELVVATLLLVHLNLFGRRVTLVRSQEQRQRALAQTDLLTGLLNRRAMCEHLELTLARPDAAQHAAVILLDLDHFKEINDLRGHDVGDKVLQLVARTLMACVRAPHQVARWGGEEFLVVLDDVTPSQAERIAERLWNALRNASEPNLPDISASLGVASVRPGDTIDSVLLRADQGLYSAKHAGRDQWQVYATRIE